MLTVLCRSSPWPCDENTLTVTISPTTPLFEGATITISALVGAHATTGDIDLMDASAGQENHLLFSTSGDVAGKADWNDDAKTLILKVNTDLECNSEYIFSFQVVNTNEGKARAPVMIEANNINPDFPGAKIDMSSMMHDVHTVPATGLGAGDAEALKLHTPEFHTYSIMQDSRSVAQLLKVSHYMLVNHVNPCTC